MGDGTKASSNMFFSKKYANYADHAFETGGLCLSLSFADYPCMY